MSHGLPACAGARPALCAALLLLALLLISWGPGKASAAEGGAFLQSSLPLRPLVTTPVELLQATQGSVQVSGRQALTVSCLPIYVVANAVQLFKVLWDAVSCPCSCLRLLWEVLVDLCASCLSCCRICTRVPITGWECCRI